MAAELVKSGEFPVSAVAELVTGVKRRRPARRIRSDPSDPKSTRRIRSRSDRVHAVRSRSNGLDPRVSLQPGRFAKEPLGFLIINPQSAPVQK